MMENLYNLLLLLDYAIMHFAIFTAKEMSWSNESINPNAKNACARMVFAHECVLLEDARCSPRVARAGANA